MLPELLFTTEVETGESDIIVVDFSLIHVKQSDKAFEKDGFPGAALSDDQVGLARFEDGGYISEHPSAGK